MNCLLNPCEGCPIQASGLSDQEKVFIVEGLDRALERGVKYMSSTVDIHRTIQDSLDSTLRDDEAAITVAARALWHRTETQC